MTTLVVMSGGLDSTTLAYHLEADRLLSFDYGQRHSRELEFAEATGARMGVPWDVVNLTGVTRFLTGSALTDDVAVPHGHYAAETMRATVVPNRNMMMISVAVAVAVAEGHDTVAVGVHAGDHPIYPDCRPEFIAAVDAAARAGTLGHAPAGFQVVAPFVEWSKTDIARRAGELGVPIELTWSCYEGGTAHCGRCGTCVERRESLHDAGVEDPTEYIDREFWLTAVGR